jgi:hypothetical protein
MPGPTVLLEVLAKERRLVDVSGVPRLDPFLWATNCE